MLKLPRVPVKGRSNLTIEDLQFLLAAGRTVLKRLPVDR